MKLTEENLYLYAAKHYYNPKFIDAEEFQEDLKRFKYIKRLLRKYYDTGILKERLLLNHIIVLHNVFGALIFLFFFSRNSATSQQNEILFIVLKPFLSDRYMVPMLSLVYLFYFLMISWLLGKKRVDFMYLWRLSADFKKFW